MHSVKDSPIAFLNRQLAYWFALRGVFALIFGYCLLNTGEARAQDADLQMWFPVQLIHSCGDRWSVSMQAEIRLQDDISEYSQLVLKPAINYHFNETWALSVGYKNINKFEDANENDIWQEVHFNKKFGDLVSGFQVRLEERLINDIDGAIPRLRFLQHLSHPIGEGPYYLTGFGAIRVNLNNRGTGPIQGYEQSRIYTAVGRHIGKRAQFEVGYLWRYEFERDGSNLNDHAVHFQLTIHTRAKKINKPTHRDRYR